jgi:hypothetical protein
MLTTLLVLAAPLPAHAAGLTEDCQDGRIDGTYSQAEYQRALRGIATDLDEYSDCRAVIRRAQLAAARRGAAGQDGGSAGSDQAGGGGAGGGASGGGTGGDPTNTIRPDPLDGATAEERRALQEAVAGGDAPVRVAGGPVRPGDGTGEADHDLPTPLLVLLVLLGVAAVVGGATVIGPRVHARRSG